MPRRFGGSGAIGGRLAVGLGILGVLALPASPLVGQVPVLAATVGCATTTTTSYAANVCLTSPLPGATVSGNVTESATVTVLSGTVSTKRVVFTIDSKYLLSDFEDPFIFTLTTTHWVDGAHTLAVSAQMTDGSTTGAAGLSVIFANGVTTPPVNNNLPTMYVPPTRSTLTVAAVGDGASGEAVPNSVVSMITGWNPDLFIYLGDVYENGAFQEFTDWYDPFWGQLRSVSDPTIGNHEYQIDSAASGYAWYWNHQPTYYSYDSSGWHFISLNGNHAKINDTAQLTWLNQDLAAHAGACIIAYWHQPRFSIGSHGDDTSQQAMWSALADAHATLVLNGHDHDYQRWTPMDANGTASPDGLAEVVSGTGGHSPTALARSDSRVLAAIGKTAGATRITLSSTAARVQFYKVDGTLFDDGTIPCKGRGSLSGTVTDSTTGQPIAGANVFLGNAAATTDSAGQYLFDPATPGSYRVIATARNYVSESMPATVTTAPLTLNITLDPDSIANGDFENGSASWILSPQASIDTNPAVAHAGSNSLELVATAGYQGTKQSITASPGQMYTFGAWGRSSTSGGQYSVVSFDATGTRLGYATYNFAGTGIWTAVAGTYITPANTARVTVSAQSNVAGTFSFDDVGLTPTNDSVANGDFELGWAGWSVAAQAGIDSNPADAHDGFNSLELVATAGYQGTRQWLALTPGQRYSITAWGRSSVAGGQYALVSYDSTGTRLGVTNYMFPGTGDWTTVAGTFTPPPNTARVALLAESNVAGTFWFDDITVTPSTDLVANGGFELGSAGWTLASTAVIDTNPADANSGTNSLELGATAANQVTVQSVAATGGQAYGLTAWGRSTTTGGEYTLASYDATGTRLGYANYFFAGTGNWTPVAGVFVAPANTVRIAILPESTALGTFWFDDVSVKPTNNLVANGGYELGATAWTLASTASIDTTPTDANSGNSSLELVATAGYQASRQSVAVNAGQSYNFSAFGKSTSGGGELTLVSYNATGTRLGYTNLPFGGIGAWLPVTFTYVAPATAARVSIVAQSTLAGTFWFDDVSLTP